MPFTKLTRSSDQFCLPFSTVIQDGRAVLMESKLKIVSTLMSTYFTFHRNKGNSLRGLERPDSTPGAAPH